MFKNSVAIVLLKNEKKKILIQISLEKIWNSKLNTKHDFEIKQQIYEQIACNPHIKSRRRRKI